MRSKQNFINDFNEHVKEEIVKEVDCVQMAAHDMRHTGELFVKVEGKHTKSGKDINFIFTKEIRPGTETAVEGQVGDSEVDDYFYQEFKEVK